MKTRFKMDGVKAWWTMLGWVAHLPGKRAPTRIADRTESYEIAKKNLEGKLQDEIRNKNYRNKNA